MRDEITWRGGRKGMFAPFVYPRAPKTPSRLFPSPEHTFTTRTRAKMSTTPTYQRSSSLPRRPSSAQRSRPTTPLRPPSRSGSFRGSVSLPPGSGALPLEALEAQFAEVSDGMADLEANFFNLGLMHESLARFSEDFASFLYGMNMNAFCVDFPEVRFRM